MREKGQPVYVQVFYEALCPDSKNFILKQLQPTFKKIPKLFEIQFVPYGKATVSKYRDYRVFSDIFKSVLSIRKNYIKNT